MGKCKITWFDKEKEINAPGPKPIEQFLKKFDDDTLDGATDNVLFYKAMSQATLESEASDDEDKREFYEEMMADVENAGGSLAYFVRVRGTTGQDTVMVLKKDDMRFGVWEGEFEPLEGIKHNVYMEWDKEVSDKIIRGDPNTDSFYLKGKLIVKNAPISLAVKPRYWISLFFEFIGREPKE